MKRKTSDDRAEYEKQLEMLKLREQQLERINAEKNFTRNV